MRRKRIRRLMRYTLSRARAAHRVVVPLSVEGVGATGFGNLD
jgi:hypothetical protein